MKTPDEHIIQRTLDSLDTIKRAEVNPFLLTRILEKMKAPLVQRIQPALARSWVMSLICIVIINIGVFMYVSRQAKSVPNQVEDPTYLTTQLYSY